MINKQDKIINQLLTTIYIDKKDPSVLRINFDNALAIFQKYEIWIPTKAYEETLNHVITERLVGKIQANDVAKWAIAQAMLNTALLLSMSKEELLKLKLRGEGVTYFDKAKK